MSTSSDLTGWIAQLFANEELLRMGHNQREDTMSLGLGWLYYGLARLVRPRRAVVIGSYRGFVPLVIGKAFTDNGEPGEVVFVDPSMVDDFWLDPAETRAYFGSLGVDNVRHVAMTTQQFAESEELARVGELGLLFVDGYHSEAQARFDYRAFESRLGPHGIALFHDSMVSRRSLIYGLDRSYDMTVTAFIDELKRDPGLQVLDLPFGTGLTLVRKTDPAVTPLREGREERPKALREADRTSRREP